MAAKKRKPIQVQRDRMRIAEMMLSGKTEREIALELKMTQQMVSYDKLVIEKEWKASREKDVDLLVAKQKKIIEKLYREALRGWERSFGTKEISKAAKTTSTEKKDGQSASKVSEELTGDPRYLTIARECMKDFRELLGLDAPKKLDLISPKTLTIVDEN